MARTTQIRRARENADHPPPFHQLPTYSQNEQASRPVVVNLVDLDPTLDDTKKRLKDYGRTLRGVFLGDSEARNVMPIKEEVYSLVLVKMSSPEHSVM